MSTITVIDTQGESRQVALTPGLSLMEVLHDEGYDEIAAMCGGCCSCATCHVHIDPNQDQPLPEMEEDEQMLVEVADNYDQQKSRLSCQIQLTQEHAGLVVTVVEAD